VNKDQDQVTELNKIAEKGARTEPLKSIAKEIERDMLQNLFHEFMDLQNDDDLEGIRWYRAVLNDFMTHVYQRCENGRVAQIELSKLTQRMRDNDPVH
jgi:hypothetical protein